MKIVSIRNIMKVIRKNNFMTHLPITLISLSFNSFVTNFAYSLFFGSAPGESIRGLSLLLDQARANNTEEISSTWKSNNQYRIKLNFKCGLTQYYLHPSIASSGDILRTATLPKLQILSVYHKTTRFSVKAGRKPNREMAFF